MSKYTLEVDNEQLKHISKALDFFARIQTGQVSELVNPYMVPLPDADYKEVDVLLKDLKKQMFPELPEGAFYSIKSKYISDQVRQMIDIFEVIRHQLMMDSDNQEVVEKNIKPFHWATDKPLPVVKKVDGDQSPST